MFSLTLGAQANGAVLGFFHKPGDAILGMTLNSGGHLSHGAAPNISGKWFKSIGRMLIQKLI